RDGHTSSIALARQLRQLAFRVDCLETDTPPLIDANIVDFSVLEAQHGDNPPPVFSFMGKRDHHPRKIPCYITHTTERT
ncbi:FAD-dependent oxidoreductase, partial [Vibrio cholerae]|uniref:FAD-dependent oxidoreductase n=1 Tax=Vibrio cholerae TaxID=666 RepID=UPI0015A4E85A